MLNKDKPFRFRFDGFTLVEIMIGITIVLLIALVMSHMFLLRNRSQQELRNRDQIAQALNTVRNVLNFAKTMELALANYPGSPALSQTYTWNATLKMISPALTWADAQLISNTPGGVLLRNAAGDEISTGTSILMRAKVVLIPGITGVSADSMFWGIAYYRTNSANQLQEIYGPCPTGLQDCRDNTSKMLFSLTGADGTWAGQPLNNPPAPTGTASPGPSSTGTPTPTPTATPTPTGSPTATPTSTPLGCSSDPNDFYFNSIQARCTSVCSSMGKTFSTFGGMGCSNPGPGSLSGSCTTAAAPDYDGCAAGTNFTLNPYCSNGSVCTCNSGSAMVCVAPPPPTPTPTPTWSGACLSSANTFASAMSDCDNKCKSNGYAGASTPSITCIAGSSYTNCASTSINGYGDTIYADCTFSSATRSPDVADCWSMSCKCVGFGGFITCAGARPSATPTPTP